MGLERRSLLFDSVSISILHATYRISSFWALFPYYYSFIIYYIQKESIDLQKLRDNSTYQCVGARIDPSLEKLEYPRNDIIYIRDIGQGAFGRVFQVSPTRN